MIVPASANFRNLERAGRIVAHVAETAELAQLLTAARAALADSEVDVIGNDTRFDAAYKAVMLCALVALMIHGWRPATGVPGHHQTMIQLLPVTLGIPADAMVELDVLRRKRNLADYTGRPVTDGELAACIAAASSLVEAVQRRLKRERPERT